MSRAYTALFLAFALHALAAVLTGEAHRRGRRLEEAATATRTGIEIATSAQYWYAVGTGERVAARGSKPPARARRRETGTIASDSRLPYAKEKRSS